QDQSKDRGTLTREHQHKREGPTAGKPTGAPAIVLGAGTEAKRHQTTDFNITAPLFGAAVGRKRALHMANRDRVVEFCMIDPILLEAGESISELIEAIERS